MKFVKWLEQQVARKDEVGFVSRLILSHAHAYNKLQKHSCSMNRFIKSYEDGKIKRGLNKAFKEWKESSNAPKVGIFWEP